MLVKRRHFLVVDSSPNTRKVDGKYHDIIMHGKVQLVRAHCSDLIKTYRLVRHFKMFKREKMTEDTQ